MAAIISKSVAVDFLMCENSIPRIIILRPTPVKNKIKRKEVLQHEEITQKKKMFENRMRN